MRDTLKHVCFLAFLVVGCMGTQCPAPATYIFPGNGTDATLTVALLGDDGSEVIMFTHLPPMSCRYLPVGHAGFLYNRLTEGGPYVGPAVQSSGEYTTADCDTLQ